VDWSQCPQAQDKPARRWEIIRILFNRGSGVQHMRDCSLPDLSCRKTKKSRIKTYRPKKLILASKLRPETFFHPFPRDQSPVMPKIFELKRHNAIVRYSLVNLANRNDSSDFDRGNMPGNKKDGFGLTFKSLILLLLLMVLFFWKILLTRQFSLLMWEEDVRQTYSWLNFIVISLKQGILPLWDPYAGAGTSFPAEMQNGAFYPLNLLLALLPLNRYGLLAPQFYHQLYAFAHFLGACFMFALVRQLGLSRFSAIIAGICFSLGGLVIHAPWPHLYESAIWLPLLFLFLLRALSAQSLKKALLYASASGLAMGLTILAGGLHIAIMQALFVVTVLVFAFCHPQTAAEKHRSRLLIVYILLCATVFGVGFCVGAVQIFPSIEYGHLALRWVGDAPPIPAENKIPYAYIKDGLAPHAYLGMVFASVIGGPGESISPYIGVFPLLAAIIGIMKCWNSLWVRYLTGLAVLAFLYTLGEQSLLHGVLYAIFPFLSMAREAGRFIYLACFALSVLAAFGIETLLCKPFQKPAWNGLNRVLMGVVIACAAALAITTFFGRPEINRWVAFSILMIFASYGLFHYVIRGRTGTSARVLIVALILFDLSAFDWLPRNKIDEDRNKHTNHLERLMSFQGAAQFLKSQPALYRVRIDDEPKLNVGHVFRIPTIDYTGVTALKDQAVLYGSISNILGVRYIIKPSSATEPGALYQDGAWKVYENPRAYPHAWIVHETMIEPSVEALRSRIDTQAIDFSRTAAVSAPLETELEPRIDGVSESARFSAYQANRLELDVEAQGRGMLVLSEIFYPGWRATVNGKKTKIHKTDGVLRGIVVPGGRSRVILQYTPISIIAGGILSLIAVLGVLLAFALQQRKRDSST
jgi:hypothetical protein